MRTFVVLILILAILPLSLPAASAICAQEICVCFSIPQFVCATYTISASDVQVVGSAQVVNTGPINASTSNCVHAPIGFPDCAAGCVPIPNASSVCTSAGFFLCDPHLVTTSACLEPFLVVFPMGVNLTLVLDRSGPDHFVQVGFCVQPLTCFGEMEGIP